MPLLVNLRISEPANDCRAGGNPPEIIVAHLTWCIQPRAAGLPCSQPIQGAELPPHLMVVPWSPPEHAAIEGWREGDA